MEVIVRRLLLTIALLPFLGVPPAAVAGSQSAPRASACIKIRTAQDLDNIRNDLSGNHCLVRDINAGSIANFIPIGDDDHSFVGTLDGMGHTIRGLTINSNLEFVGLFGAIGPDGSVRDLALDDAKVIGTSSLNYVGGLAGNNKGKIHDVSLSGFVVAGPVFCDENECTATGAGEVAAGNSGEINFASASVILSVIDGSVSTLGGLVGYNSGRIAHSQSSGIVTGAILGPAAASALPTSRRRTPGRGAKYGSIIVRRESGKLRVLTMKSRGQIATSRNLIETSDISMPPVLGGLVGANFSEIIGSKSSAAVTGGSSGGGLAVINTGIVTTSYSLGPVDADRTCGGLVNWNEGLVEQSYAAGPVTCGSTTQTGGLIGTLIGRVDRSYSVGAVASGGGLIGYKFAEAEISRSYWDTVTSGQTTSAGGRPHTTAQLKAGLPAGFGAGTWGIVSDVSYPFLLGHGWLSFPIEGHTAYSAPLSAVLDHSGTPLDLIRETRRNAFYRNNQAVLAYTGEKGEKMYGGNCAKRGYKNQDATPFRLNGNYVGTDCATGRDPKLYLSYDGHAGYDYPVAKLTPVYAPADGELRKASLDRVNIPKGCTTLTAWDAWHAFYIDHGNGYTTWYLHTDGLDPAIESEIGTDYTKSVHVNRGDRIAFSGTFGPCGDPDGTPTQLHFEVRRGLDQVVDPYSEAFWIAP